MSNKIEFPVETKREIQRRLTGGESKATLSSEFGVHHSVITRIGEEDLPNGRGRPRKLSEVHLDLAEDLYVRQNKGSVEIAATLVETFPAIGKLTAATVLSSLRDRRNVKTRSAGRPKGSSDQG